MSQNRLAGSFRDPAGFVFSDGTTIYRQVNNSYKTNYVHLIQSGLYRHLVNENLLVKHEEVEDFGTSSSRESYYKILKPEPAPFVSYPYEWCFSQLKKAALLTLEVQSISLKYGMSLKDASAYNIQFFGSKPVLIDSLSFEIQPEGAPWAAYQQFSQHFLAPLILMSYVDLRLNSLAKIYLDGIPLALTCKLLPWRAWLNFHHLLHLLLQAKLQNKIAWAKPDNNKAITLSNRLLNTNKIHSQAIIEDLKETINGLKVRELRTTWSDYYNNNNYSQQASENKQNIVSGYIDQMEAKTICDFGSNDGLYSRLIASKTLYVVSTDVDPLAVEYNFQKCLTLEKQNVLPLLIDITNPSPAIGWSNQERYSFLERGPLDCSLALGLIHHLVISNDLQFFQIAKFFAQCAKALIIEFIPSSDSQIQRLLSAKTTSASISEYNQLKFENEFRQFFDLVHCTPIEESERIIYLMTKRQNL